MWENRESYKAIIYAAQKHKNQMMKHPEETPYLAHIVGVMTNAIKYASMLDCKIDWELLINCALLHDVIEDTDTTYEEIESEFGEKTAHGVLALTKNKTLKKSEQMKDSIRRIKEQPLEVGIVKLSDRLFNMRDVVPHWSENKLLSYCDEAKYICDELGGICKPLKDDLNSYIDEYSNEINKRLTL